MRKLEGKRFFIIDDNIMNLAVFTTTLKHHGAQVIQDHWNVSLPEFILGHLPIDLILLDLMLRKGISGYDVFDELQTYPKLAEIPVVMVSSADPEVEIPKAKAKGLAGFISKPISQTQFPEQIEAILKGQKVWVFTSDQGRYSF